MGSFRANTVPADPQTDPHTWEKQYHTLSSGSAGSYTIVVDRFALGSSPNMYQAVYPGCKVRSWSLSVALDQPVIVSADFIAHDVITTGGAAILTTPYEQASVGKPMAFMWRDCEVRIGNEGVRGSHKTGYLKYFRFRQDNKLDMSRYYLDGVTNMVDPEAGKSNTGVLALEYDYAAQVDTEIFDRYESDQIISVELTMRRPPYSAVFWFPSVHISQPDIDGQKSGVAKVAVSGTLTWDRNTPDHAVYLTIMGEGDQP